VPEHAELHLLALHGDPPLLARARADLQGAAAAARDKDLSTYGFLGYPLLQTADIVVYKATLVPVGEDQAPHIELTPRDRAALQPSLRPVFPSPRLS
jgi:tryptophanyl-tRNA synthetase